MGRPRNPNRATAETIKHLLEIIERTRIADEPLCISAGVGVNVITRLRNGQPVTMNIIEKLSEALGYQVTLARVPAKREAVMRAATHIAVSHHVTVPVAMLSDWRNLTGPKRFSHRAAAKMLGLPYGVAA